MPKGDVKIAPYDSANHHGSCYYFRVAAADQNGQPDATSRPISIPKNGFVNVCSLERFELSERVLGLFGGLTDLISRGLQLVHSPAIDPLFKGSLALGIRNMTENAVELRVGDKVGEVLFFDVSDSLVAAHQAHNEVRTKEEELRQYAKDVIYRANSDALRHLLACQ